MPRRFPPAYLACARISRSCVLPRSRSINHIPCITYRVSREHATGGPFGFGLRSAAATRGESGQPFIKAVVKYAHAATVSCACACWNVCECVLYEYLPGTVSHSTRVMLCTLGLARAPEIDSLAIYSPRLRQRASTRLLTPSYFLSHAIDKAYLEKCDAKHSPHTLEEEERNLFHTNGFYCNTR